MKIISPIIGIIVGMLVLTSIFNLLISFVPPTTCHDGWKSSSIGFQGACSHHEGVNAHETEKTIVFTLSVIGGLFAGFTVYRMLPEKWRISEEERMKMELILQIQSALENKKHIQFFYKTPKQENFIKRIVVPIAIKNRKYLLGFCENMQAERTFAISRIKDLKLL